MLIYPSDTAQALSIVCPACGARTGVYCGTTCGEPAVHERRDRA